MRTLYQADRGAELKSCPFHTSCGVDNWGSHTNPELHPRAQEKLGGSSSLVPPALLMRLPCEQGSFEGKTVRAADVASETATQDAGTATPPWES